MEILKSLRNGVIVFLSLGVIFLGTSCESEPVEDRPDLPPISSFIMDYSDFDEPASNLKAAVPSFANFTHAYGNIVFWNAFTTVTLALPVTAYAYALNKEPEYMGNNKWEWSYDFKHNNIDYKATLTAERMNNEEFSADMSINLKALPGKGVTWFDGVIRYDHTHAGWNLYKNENASAIKIIEVDWSRNYETDEGTMKYTLVEPGHEEEGSYIMLEIVTPDPEIIDAAYTISLAAGDIDIEWNRTTKAGRVADPVHFQDDLWHCWDYTLVDAVCDVPE